MKAHLRVRAGTGKSSNLERCCRLQSLLFGCLPISRQNTPTGNYDTERAALVDWLSKYKHSLDVAAINADLNTPIHCASQSNSPTTLKVMNALSQCDHTYTASNKLYPHATAAPPRCIDTLTVSNELYPHAKFAVCCSNCMHTHKFLCTSVWTLNACVLKF